MQDHDAQQMQMQAQLMDLDDSLLDRMMGILPAGLVNVVGTELGHHPARIASQVSISNAELFIAANPYNYYI